MLTMDASLRIGECISEHDRHISRTSFTSHMRVFCACNLCSDQVNKHVQDFFIWVSYHDEHARSQCSTVALGERESVLFIGTLSVTLSPRPSLP